MKNVRHYGLWFGMSGLVMLCAGAQAETVILRRDAVIPVVLEDKLTVSGSHVGDSFTARVADDLTLPKNTELIGRIEGIHRSNGSRPNSMDLRFVRIILPNNTRVKLDAAAIPLDDHWVTRSGDGRLVAKQDVRKQQNDILGGAVGGFIVGSIFHRRITGAVLGTILGSAVAASDREKDNDLIANSGDKLGALVNREIAVDIRSDRSHFAEDHSVVRTDSRAADAKREAPGTYDPVKLNFSQTELQLPADQKPYWIGHTLMVPLEAVGNQLGLIIEKKDDRTYYVDSKDDELRVTVFSRHTILNGKELVLPRTIVDRDGVVYIPLDGLVKICKDAVLVNGTKYDYHP